MARIATRTLAAALVALPVAVAANGGPVELPDVHGAEGGLVPLQETTVSLVSERLRVALSDTCISELVPRVYCPLASQAGSGVAPRSVRPAPPRPPVPPPIDAERACLAKVDARMQDAVHAQRGAWACLVDACRACGRPYRGDDDALGWRRCEIALEVEAEDRELRARSRRSAPDDEALRDELKRRLQAASEREQRSLYCVGMPGCPQ